MQKIGLACITIGFLGGAYLSVLDETTVDWTSMSAALLLGVIGVILVMIAKKGEATHEETIAENIKTIDRALANLIEKVGQLDAGKQDINTYDMSHKIDELLLEDIDDFVEARETIGHAYGLQAYADVMSHFAAGERYLNRIWSASADGYIDEVNAYLPRAHAQFVEAQEKLVQARVGMT